MCKAKAYFPKEQVEEIFEIFQGKPDYNKNIVTYQIVPGKNQFVILSDENKRPQEIFFDIIEDVDKSKKKNTTYNNLITFSIKSKKDLIKLLNNLPYPMIFGTTILFTFLCVLMLCVIALVDYFIFPLVFDKIATQMKITRLERDCYINTMIMSSDILQMIAYNM